MEKTHQQIVLLLSAAALVVLAVVFFVFVLPRLSTRNLVEMPAGFHVNPIDGLSPDFIMGADVSMLAQVEQSGGRFSVNGVEKDALQILKDHGVNWIRLRIWNDPTDANGNGLGGGNNDLARTAAVAARARQLGLKVLLDFHYSDWWADPAKQNKPRAWADLQGADLQQALYDYTAEVIRTLVEAGATPDMVQLGNEINGGMLWPDGQTYQEGDRPFGGFDGLAALLNEGIRAVQDNDPKAGDPEKRIRIMIHLADGGKNDLFRYFFDALSQRGVEFDVIGMSYYSYWHGSLEELIENANDISARYGRPIVIAETAYPFTLDAGDEHSNLFGDGLQERGGYEATVQGQATAMHDLVAAMAQVPDGLGRGIFYWEPTWIPVAGAGWAAGQGNPWENQAMFDFDGNALPSLNVFRQVRPGNSTFVPAAIVRILPLEIKLPLAASLELPETVRAVYSDDSIRKVPVSWADFDPALLQRGGSFTVGGAVEASGLPAVANVTVSSQMNFLTNPGFETGDLGGWNVAEDARAVNVSSEAQNVYRGAYSGHYWLGGPFQFTLSQTVTGLSNGAYSFSLWIQGGGGEDRLQLFARDCGGEDLSIDVVNTGWQVWTNPTLTGIQVADGSCTVGMTVVSSGGSWAFYDEASLVRDK